MCITALCELPNVNELNTDDSGIGTGEKSGRIGKMRKNARTVLTN